MTVISAEIMQLSAQLLAYPEAEWFLAELDNAHQFLQLVRAEDKAYALLLQAVETMAQKSPYDLAREYVDTFDFQESCALYLTAHEYGDARERGTALVELRQMLLQVGCAETMGELPDYLPLLLEFLATQSGLTGSQALTALMMRIGKLCAKIAGQLPTGSTYQPIFAALLIVLPTDEEAEPPLPLATIEQDVPYPLPFE